MKPSHLLMISATTFSLNREINYDRIASTNVVSAGVINNFKLDFAPTYTNFNFYFKDEISFNPITDVEDFEGDFDLDVPLKLKSFKVKAHVKSVSKLVPKPFFD